MKLWNIADLIKRCTSQGKINKFGFWSVDIVLRLVLIVIFGGLAIAGIVMVMSKWF